MTTQTDGPDWFHAQGAAPDAPTVVGSRPAEAHLPAPGAAAPDSPDDRWNDDLLEEWVPQRRTNRLTAVLAVAVIAACTFTAGALVDKQFGGAAPATATARGGFARGAGFGAGGLPSGGFQGGGFPGGGVPTGATGQAGQGGAPGSGTAAGGGAPAALTPSVVGTVKSLSGNDLVVENFAGKRITVHVPATATVTTPGLSGVVAGMTVSVVGTAGADGSVTATSVSARKA